MQMAQDKRLPNEEAVLHWLLMSTLNDGRLDLVINRMTHELGEVADDEELQRHGCRKDVLAFTLALAWEITRLSSKSQSGAMGLQRKKGRKGRSAKRLYPNLSASKLQKLARDLSNVLDRMKDVIPAVYFSALEGERQEEGEFFSNTRGGVLHVTEELERELKTKINAYAELASYCRLGAIKSQATLRTIVYIWPVVYINSVTNKPHFRNASELLQKVGITKDEAQLQKIFSTARKKYPRVLKWLEVWTTVVHKAGDAR
jgi:hypothetical protein